MKFKSFIIAALTLSNISSVYGSDSLRLGLSFGVSNHRISSKNSKTDEKSLFTKSVPASGVLMGYDHLIKDTPLFLGMEISGTNHNMEDTQEGSYYLPYTMMVKTNNTISGSLRFGVMANDTLLYGKLGGASTNFQVVVNAKRDENRVSYQKMGYISGFGMENKLNANFSLGFEHEYTFHRHIQNMKPGLCVRLKPIVQKTSFRLIYNF